MNKVVIISAPSGAGKTTIVKNLLEQFPQLEFSVSACSRPQREGEKNGIDYYFISVQEFQQKINENKFIEWEEVYPNRYYGTLKEEIERIWNKNHIVLFDVDVKGGINLKKIFQNNAISIFISPPSIEILKERLINRGTENEESLKMRVEKAAYEMTFAKQFDYIVVNDNLSIAIEEIKEIVKSYINS
ncbi:MAG: guanylate kinase [Bacteroidales bacterium]|nr:guanylate kinase [Bacteroidales bacterium]